MYPAICTALTRAGITSKMASNIRDSPTSSGGSDIHSLFHFQRISMTTMIVEQISGYNHCNILLMICQETYSQIISWRS